MKIIELLNTAIKFLSNIFEWIKFKQRINDIVKQRADNNTIDKAIDTIIKSKDIQSLNDQLGFKVSANATSTAKAITKKAVSDKIKKTPTKKAPTKKTTNKQK
jgi:hypothetical protein